MPKVSVGQDVLPPLFGSEAGTGRGISPRLRRALGRTVALVVLYLGTPACMALAIVGAHNTIGARQDVVRYSTARTCVDGRTRDCLLVQTSTISRTQASSSGANPTTDVYLRIPGIADVKEAIVDEDTGSTLKAGESVTTTRWNGPTVLIVAGGLRLTTEAGPQNRADKQETITFGGFLAALVLLCVLRRRWFGRRVERARFRRIDLIAVPAVLACVSALYLLCDYTAGFRAIVAGPAVVALSCGVVPRFFRRC